MIYASNFLYQPILGMMSAAGLLNSTAGFWIFLTTFIIFPTPAFGVIFAKNLIDYFTQSSGAGSINFISKKMYTGSLIALGISVFFYLGLAIYIDHKKNMQMAKTNEFHEGEQTQEALVGQHVVVGENTIEQERRIALENRSDIPIQAAGVSKCFSSALR
jgi:hypothetical protein